MTASPSHARLTPTPVRSPCCAPPVALRSADRRLCRTAEAQALVRSKWAHDLVAARPVVRARAPRVVALDDSGYAQERDPAASTARLPSVALRAARTALRADRPVLVQVPRRGYVPALACARCRTVARCRTAPARCRCPTEMPPGRCAGGAAVRNPRCAVPDAAPMRCVPSSSGPAAPPRNSAGRFRHHGDHLRRRGRGIRGARRAGRRRRDTGTEPVAPAATARRCCSTAGLCSAGRTSRPPRTRCGGGWPPPPWCAAAPTAG